MYLFFLCSVFLLSSVKSVNCWVGGMMAQSTSRGADFNSQQSHVGSQPSTVRSGENTGESMLKERHSWHQHIRMYGCHFRRWVQTYRDGSRNWSTKEIQVAKFCFLELLRKWKQIHLSMVWTFFLTKLTKRNNFKSLADWSRRPLVPPTGMNLMERKHVWYLL